ncbi:hypothetical protein D3C73_1186250 [compost metagenome]
MRIARDDLVEGLDFVHHADTPGQTTIVKAPSKSQPAEASNRPPAPALLGQIVKRNAWILDTFGRQVVIVVTVNDIPFNTSIRDPGPAFQILIKGQRELINIGHV